VSSSEILLTQPGLLFVLLWYSSEAAAVQNGAERGAEEKLKFAKAELKKVVKHVSVLLLVCC
jgi:hypothetical protein